jgi:hypothetical protein
MKIPMFSPRPANGFHARFTLMCAAFLCMGVAAAVNSARADSHEELPGIAGAPYPNMPGIPPTGVRIGKHLEVPESAKGPTINHAKGYRLQELGKGLYMITDNCYQSMFMVYEDGVVVIDAPTSYAQYIPKRSLK